MLRLIAVSLFVSLFSLTSLKVDTPRTAKVVNNENQVTTTLNVFDEPFAEPTIVFHYHRSDAVYTGWDLWIWGQNENGKAYTYTGTDTYGKYLYLPVSTFSDQTQVNFIIRPGSWTQQSGDINIKYVDFTLQTDNAYHFYLINLEENVYHSAEEVLGGRILEAEFSTPTNVYVATNIATSTYTLRKDGAEVISGNTNDSYVAASYKHQFNVTIPGSHEVELLAEYTIEVVFEDNTNPNKTSDVAVAGLFDHPLFVDDLTYDGTDLGVTYTPSASTFKAWAPTTKDLKLRLYNSGTPTLVDPVNGDDTYQEYTYVKGEKGTWTVTVSGDLHNKYYTLVATNAAGINEFVDPYARAAGISGLRGLVVDFSKTNPEGWNDVDFSVKKPTEIIPYELHVADLTADDTWNGEEVNRKKFLGLIEESTTYTEGQVTVKTGFDHIKELGVNAVQILPFYDQENDETNVSFNWGYNPRNYNVLEGAYSANPYDGLVRINEFKQVVKKYAEADIRIIMDVVYNHVANISGHSFSKLVPGYYFRYTENGGPSNASGVGNDTASERIMMARYMTDSTYFLASEYKLGGFRFDLMGLHTVEAMNMLSQKLHDDYREDILIYGEAWQMDTTAMSVTKPLAKYSNVDSLYHVGAFNDQIRDAAKGGVFKDTDKGFVQTPVSGVNVEMKNRLKFGLLGKVYNQGTTDPTKTINYVSVHDNNTLYDKIRLAAAGTSFATDLGRLRRQALQAQTLILTAQGVSFLHAGSEMLRSKPLGDGKYDHNSYQSSYEINSLKWDEKIDNLDIFNYYQDLIAIKRDIPAFQYDTRELVDQNVTVEFGSEIGFDDTVIKMTVLGEDRDYVVYFVGAHSSRVKLDLKGLEVMVDTSANPKEAGYVFDGEYQVFGNTTLVLRGKSRVSTNTGCFGSIEASLLVVVVLLGVGGFFAIKRKKA